MVKKEVKKKSFQEWMNQFLNCKSCKNILKTKEEVDKGICINCDILEEVEK